MPNYIHQLTLIRIRTGPLKKWIGYLKVFLCIDGVGEESFYNFTVSDIRHFIFQTGFLIYSFLIYTCRYYGCCQTIKCWNEMSIHPVQTQLSRVMWKARCWYKVQAGDFSGIICQVSLSSQGRSQITLIPLVPPWLTLSQSTACLGRRKLERLLYRKPYR